MSDEIDPDRVAELEAQVAELKARLEAQEERYTETDGGTRTRRQVLGSIAAGGVLGGLAGAGSAAGATGGEDTGAMVGALAGPPYQVADPGLFSGPDASKSSISHSVGQVHFAQDTGARYYDDGSNWDLLPIDAINHRVGRAEFIGPASGTDLSEELRDRIDNGITKIHIHEPRDGSAYSFDSTLDLDVSSPGGGAGTPGVQITADVGVKVESSLTDWWLDVSNDRNAGNDQLATFHLQTPEMEWQFTGDQTANPGVPGFLRLTDVTQPHIDTNTRGFENGSGNGVYGTGAGDATTILFRTDTLFTEGWRLSGDLRGCDRGVDFTDLSGNKSFVDGHANQLSINARDFCIRLTDDHRTNTFTSLHCFPQADNARGVVLDGRNTCVFTGFRYDDVGDTETGDVAIQTTANFVGNDGGAQFIQPLFRFADTEVNKNSTGHNVWITGSGDFDSGTANDYVVREAGENDAGFRVSRTGQFEIVDDSGNVVWEFASDSSVSNPAVGSATFDDTVIFSSQMRLKQQNSPFLGTDEGTLYPASGGESIDRDLDGSATTASAGDLLYKYDIGGTESTVRVVAA